MANDNNINNNSGNHSVDDYHKEGQIGLRTTLEIKYTFNIKYQLNRLKKAEDLETDKLKLKLEQTSFRINDSQENTISKKIV